MRRLVLGGLLATLFALPPRPAAALEASLELRHTPMRVRPSDLPSLCPMLAVSPLPHLWLGAGYELLQDYNAIVWSTEHQGRKPIVMSGLRAGAWYRGGDARDGLTYGVGAIVTYANRRIAFDPQPDGLDNSTMVVDAGVDFSIGRVWQHVRLEVFATPAWSYGQVRSPAIHREERLSAFTYRFGGAIAFLFGEPPRPSPSEARSGP